MATGGHHIRSYQPHLIALMAVPEFPTEHRLAPRQPKSVRLAVGLALLLGPLGLFYTSTAAGLFTLFLAMVLGLFTVGIGLIPVWMLCVMWAYIGTQHWNAHLDGSPVEQ